MVAQIFKPGLLLDHHRKTKIREAKGILVNTFMELESGAISSLCGDGKLSPMLFPVGPILDLTADDRHVGSVAAENESDVIGCLDDQPPCSAVFLCFGGLGVSLRIKQKRLQVRSRIVEPDSCGLHANAVLSLASTQILCKSRSKSFSIVRLAEGRSLVGPQKR